MSSLLTAVTTRFSGVEEEREAFRGLLGGGVPQRVQQVQQTGRCVFVLNEVKAQDVIGVFFVQVGRAQNSSGLLLKGFSSENEQCVML